MENKKPDKKEEAKALKRRKDYEINHKIIRKAYIDMINSEARCPTVEEVAQYTHLGRATVERHLNNLTFAFENHPLRVLTEDVIIAIYNSALEGGAAAQKLWVQLMESWSEKTILDHQSKGQRLGDVNVIVKGTKSKLLEWNEN